MADVPAPEKAFYSLVEVAEICGRPPGLVRRWVFRRQLDVIWMDDDTPLVPLRALRARLRHPHRIERSLRGRRALPAGDEAAASKEADDAVGADRAASP